MVAAVVGPVVVLAWAVLIAFVVQHRLATVHPVKRGEAVITPPPHKGPIQLPQSLIRTNPGGGPTIAVDQAERAIRDWWPLDERARAQNDGLAISALEDGPAAEFSLAVTRDNLVRGGNLRTVRPLRHLVVLVPEQHGYPAVFLAEVDTTLYRGGGSSPGVLGDEVTDIVVMRRSNASESWKAVIYDEGAFIGWPVFQPDAGPDGFEHPPSPGLKFTPATIPGLLAAYRQKWVDTRAHPSLKEFPFDDGVETSRAMQNVIDEMPSTSAKGLVDSLMYEADKAPDQPYVFGYRQPPTAGWALACFAFRYTDIYRSATGGLLYQDREANNWGSWLGPGFYSAITDYGLHQTCAAVPTVGSPYGIAVLGDERGVVDVRGTP
jgi:hypothetical protein